MIVEAAAYDIPAHELTLALYKGTVQCGHCGRFFEKYIPFRYRPVVSCTHCGTHNEIPVAPESQI
jgi:hypothetical protein